jgi:hypothetical protein
MFAGRGRPCKRLLGATVTFPSAACPAAASALARPAVPRAPSGDGRHTVRRQGGRIEAVILLEIDVPRSWLRRSKKGLWDCLRDIPPERILGAVTFAALARSPVEEAAAAGR